MLIQLEPELRMWRCWISNPSGLRVLPLEVLVELGGVLQTSTTHTIEELVRLVVDMRSNGKWKC
jgi:hypothetical protein